MHIAIEGLDGAGKTSTAKLLASEMGYIFLRNPIYNLVSEDGIHSFIKNLNKVNGDLYENVASLFYGAGNLYLNYFKPEKNIITDRHLCSTYLWNINRNNKIVFDFLVEECGKPDLTIILYAEANIRKKRILDRNPHDPDLEKDIFNDEKYDRAMEFVKQYNMNYIYLDNSYMTIEETVNEIKDIIKRKEKDV